MDKSEVEMEEEYDSKSYWDSRYVKPNGFEWYYSFDILEPLLTNLLTKEFSGSVLEIGCGDKPLLEGFVAHFPSSGSLLGIDYAQNVIDLLVKAGHDKSIKYQQMDARRTNIASDSLDFVMDKGTMDAMLAAKDRDQAFSNASKIFREVVRTMKSESRYMIVSHIEADSEQFHELMQEVILPALDAKRTVLWDIVAHEVSSNSAHRESGKGRGTVYIISSKLRKFTRNMLASGAIVPFSVQEYSESEGEEEDCEGDEDEDEEQEEEE